MTRTTHFHHCLPRTAPILSITANGYEQAAREQKAKALADILTSAGITAHDVIESATEDTWRLAAEAAHVKPASNATRQMVIAIMRRRAA